MYAFWHTQQKHYSKLKMVDFFVVKNANWWTKTLQINFVQNIINGTLPNRQLSICKINTIGGMSHYFSE